MAGKEDAIKTKVVVEGEKEYREACKGISFLLNSRETKKALRA